MLRSFKQIVEKPVYAIDGEAGKIKDLILGEDGVVGCLVVQSDLRNEEVDLRIDQTHFNHLPRRRELPLFPIKLTTKQVARCPEWHDNDADELADWISYSPPVDEDRWETTPFECGTWMEGSPADEMQNSLSYGGPPMVTDYQNDKPEKARFFSARGTQGFQLQTRDDSFGRVDDFLFDDSTWMVHYIMVETQKWLPGSRHCINVKWLKKVDEDNQVAVLDMNRDQIRGLPEDS